MSDKPEDRRLLEENALLVIPSVAKTVGLNEALILQQIHYWLLVAEKNKTNYRDGNYWTYNSVRAWQEQFQFWHKDTIRRAIVHLENKGILITGRYNKLNKDQTKWYRIDYEALCEAMQNAEVDYCKKQECQSCKLHKPLPNSSIPDITTTNTTNKKTLGNSSTKNPPTVTLDNYLAANNNDHNVDNIEAVQSFVGLYKKSFGKQHPKFQPETWGIIIDDILNLEIKHPNDKYGSAEGADLTSETIKTMAEHYFQKKYREGCNYSIAHFNDSEIKRIIYHEAIC